MSKFYLLTLMHTRERAKYLLCVMHFFALIWRKISLILLQLKLTATMIPYLDKFGEIKIQKNSNVHQ